MSGSALRKDLAPACVVTIEYDDRASVLRGERLELEGSSQSGGGSRTATALRARLHGRTHALARAQTAPPQGLAQPSPQVELDWDPQNDPETDFDLDEVVRTMRISRDRLAVDSPVRLAERAAAARAPAQIPRAAEPAPLEAGADDGPCEAPQSPRAAAPANHTRAPLHFGGPAPEGYALDTHALQTRALLRLGVPALPSRFAAAPARTAHAAPSAEPALTTDEILLEELELAEPSLPAAEREPEEPETGTRLLPPRQNPPGRLRETVEDYDAFAEGAPARRARIATPAVSRHVEPTRPAEAELLGEDSGWTQRLRDGLATRRAWLVGAALALAGGAAFMALRGPATVELTVEVSPADAQISLDGHRLEGAGARRTRLTRGPHQLLAQKAGFVSEQRALSVNERASSLSAVITLAPVQKSATLSVSSIPSGAHIRVDGRDTGKTTPAALVDLPLGAHAVGLALPGYVDAEQGVRLPEDALVTVSLQPVTVSAHELPARAVPPPPAAREIVRAAVPPPPLTEALLERRARVNAARATCRHAGRAHEPLDPAADEVLRAIGESCKSIMEAGAAASAR